MSDIDNIIKNKEIIFLKIALKTKDYDIIVALITLLFTHTTIRYELSYFIKDLIKEDEYLKSRLRVHKHDKSQDILLWNKVNIENWIRNVIMIERENKINTILNGKSIRTHKDHGMIKVINGINYEVIGGDMFLNTKTNRIE